MKDKKQFAERFNSLLDELEIPPKHSGRIQYVAELFGLTHRGAGKWVNGLALPPKKKRELVAKKLGINFEWLEFGRGEMLIPDAEPMSYKPSEIPILTMYQVSLYPESLDRSTLETVYVDLDISDNSFGVYMHDNSMMPMLPKDTLLIVDPNVKPKNNEYVVIYLINEKIVVARRILSADDNTYYIALDPTSPPIPKGKQAKFIGKVVQARVPL